MEETNKTCCFFGHRKIKATDELKDRLYRAIESLIPLAFSRRPRDAAVMPFPRPETTPPVTKIYFVIACHSHSTVAGGLLVTSYTTRLMPGTSFVIRLLALSSTS